MLSHSSISGSGGCCCFLWRVSPEPQDKQRAVELVVSLAVSACQIRQARPRFNLDPNLQKHVSFSNFPMFPIPTLSW
jgi:hypothetical protein